MSIPHAHTSLIPVKRLSSGSPPGIPRPAGGISPGPRGHAPSIVMMTPVHEAAAHRLGQSLERRLVIGDVLGVVVDAPASEELDVVLAQGLLEAVSAAGMRDVSDPEVVLVIACI